MKYVIFDIDGTLANTKKVDDKCFIKAFEETFRIDINNQKWEALQNVTDWGITEEIILRELGREPYKSEYDTMLSNLLRKLEEEKIKDKNQFLEVHGAKNFFEQLRQLEGIELGIATGAWEKSAELKLDAIGINPNDICFSNSNYHKSRENITMDVIHQLNKQTKTTPERIIYFGDGEWDFKTSNNLKIDFIGIDIEGNGKLKNLGAKTVFKDYRNNQKILEAIKKVA